MKRMVLSVYISVIFFTSVLCTVQPPNINSGILSQSKSLGDCQSCKLFIESFKAGLDRTTRGKYEGGDTAWEEEKLKKSYKRSEMRLVDIQEGLCKESKHSIQCHHIAEKAEEFIEEWWAQDPDESDDLFKYICIDKLQVCCPKHHFGKDCTPCPGDHANLCSGNGKCRGDGTRKGNGTCLCDPGYTGENCNQCSSGYYLSYKDDNKMLCSVCHRSCMGGCRGGTAKDCVACKSGYVFDSEEGCIDINECDDLKRCTTGQFCENRLGSYACIACDKSCNGCHGDGPDLCRKCAKGYSKKGELCIADREDEDQSETLTTTSINTTTQNTQNLSENKTLIFNKQEEKRSCKTCDIIYFRYITYIGLLIATVILLPKSPSLGGIVGIMVISYIVGAEYYCMINGHAGLVNMKDFDLIQLFRT